MINPSYNIEEVCFKNNTDNVTLSGTLTIPNTKNKPPVVMLIAGMGANDRDYNIMNNKLFLELSNHLVKNGIATLRYDKRGVGKSTGTYNLSVTSKDLSHDALAGIDFLKTHPKINTQQIGLLGHSEGGMIAPMIAKDNKDVSFLVLMAGAAATGIDDMVEEIAMQLRADGASEKLILLNCNTQKEVFKTVAETADINEAKNKLKKLLVAYLETLTTEQLQEAEKFTFTFNKGNIANMIKFFNSKWYRYFLSYSPFEALKQINIPTLAVNGELDFITTAKITLTIIEKALKESGNKDYKTVELPKLNHWMQTCEKGSMDEYGTSKEILSPSFLNTVTEWILQRTK